MLTTTTTTIFICTHFLLRNNKFDNEIIKGNNLEYWLPRITIRASAARQPLVHLSVVSVDFAKLFLFLASNFCVIPLNATHSRILQ